MTALQRFYILVALIVLIAGALAAIARLLWRLASQWTTAVHELADLGEDIKALVERKEAEHRWINNRIDTTDARVGRHEQWHHDEQMARRRPKPPPGGG